VLGIPTARHGLTDQRAAARPGPILSPSGEGRANPAAAVVGMHHRVRIPALEHLGVAHKRLAVEDTDALAGEVEARPQPVADDVFVVNEGLADVMDLTGSLEISHWNGVAHD